MKRKSSAPQRVGRVHPQIAWAKLCALREGAAMASKKPNSGGSSDGAKTTAKLVKHPELVKHGGPIHTIDGSAGSRYGLFQKETGV